jgi:hypothetical protein
MECGVGRGGGLAAALPLWRIVEWNKELRRREHKNAVCAQRWYPAVASGAESSSISGRNSGSRRSSRRRRRRRRRRPHPDRLSSTHIPIFVTQFEFTYRQLVVDFPLE